MTMNDLFNVLVEWDDMTMCEESGIVRDFITWDQMNFDAEVKSIRVINGVLNVELVRN